MTNMKQKKLEASCSRRQNLKQTRPRSQSSEPEKNGPSEDNKSHTPSQTECIVVPAVSLDRDANEGSDPEITEYDESETNDLEVIINGNTDPKDCEEIDSKICDLTDNSGKNENGNINTEELNSEENTEEGESGKTQQTLKKKEICARVVISTIKQGRQRRTRKMFVKPRKITTLTQMLLTNNKQTRI